MVRIEHQRDPYGAIWAHVADNLPAHVGGPRRVRLTIDYTGVTIQDPMGDVAIEWTVADALVDSVVTLFPCWNDWHTREWLLAGALS